MPELNRHSSATPNRRAALKGAGASLLCLAVAACSRADTSTFAPAHVAGAGKPFSIKGAGSLINSYRRKRGRKPVSPDPVLQKAAMTQARLMAKHRKMGHVTGRGTGFNTRIRQAGFQRAAGENVAAGYETMEQTMAGWMRSTGHRRNMLDRQFAHYGVAVAKDKNGRPYWALILGM